MAFKYKPIILIIDDEEAILSSMKENLEDNNFHVETTADASKVLNLIGTLIPNLVFIDIFMPDANGIELIRLIKKEFPAQKIITISGYGNISLAVQALQAGALDFLEKPFSIEELLAKTNLHINITGINAHNEEEKILPSIIGESYLFKELVNYINKLVPLKNPLLISGPQGSGKSLIAEYIHRKKHGSVIDPQIIDCASQQLEFNDLWPDISTTIILKNINHLSTENQKKLADHIKKHIPSRIICLTAESLYQLTVEKKFTEELFSLLNSTPIEIPSLNKRRFDIPLLVKHFLEKLSEKLNTSFECSVEAMRFLRNHHWTRDCLELQEVLFATATHLTSHQENLITLDALALFIDKPSELLVPEQQFSEYTSLQEATDAFQSKFMLHQLKKNHFDLTQTSNILNISKNELENEILRLNISTSI